MFFSPCRNKRPSKGRYVLRSIYLHEGFSSTYPSAPRGLYFTTKSNLNYAIHHHDGIVSTLQPIWKLLRSPNRLLGGQSESSGLKFSMLTRQLLSRTFHISRTKPNSPPRHCWMKSRPSHFLFIPTLTWNGDQLHVNHYSKRFFPFNTTVSTTSAPYHITKNRKLHIISEPHQTKKNLNAKN